MIRIARNHHNAVAFEAFRLVDGAQGFRGRFRMHAGPSPGKFGMAVVGGLEIPELDRVLKFFRAIDLHPGKIPVGACHFLNSAQGLRHAPVIGFRDQAPGKLLDDERPALAFLATLRGDFFRKAIAERGCTEPDSDLFEELEGDLADRFGIPGGSGYALRQLVEGPAGVSLPDGQAPVEDSAQAVDSGVLGRQHEQRRPAVQLGVHRFAFIGVEQVAARGRGAVFRADDGKPLGERTTEVDPATVPQDLSCVLDPIPEFRGHLDPAMAYIQWFDDVGGRAQLGPLLAGRVEIDLIRVDRLHRVAEDSQSGAGGMEVHHDGVL